MLSKVLCHIDGGIGNRFGNLINGLWLAEKFSCPLHINWPVTNWCAGLWSDLFEDSNNVTVFSNISDIFKDVNSTIGNVYSHCDATWLKEYAKNNTLVFNTFARSETNSEAVLNKIKASNSDWIMCNDNMPWRCISSADISRLAKKYIVPNSVLTKIINDFCNNNGIDKNTTGIHIRGTDGTNNFNLFYSVYIAEINQSLQNGKKVFVCTDDKLVCDDLANRYGDKIIILPKTVYVEKCVQTDSWRGGTNVTQEIKSKLESEGIKVSNRIDFNVVRSKEQIQTAVCDMFILARTNILSRTIVHSTFLDFARYLS